METVSSPTEEFEELVTWKSVSSPSKSSENLRWRSSKDFWRHGGNVISIQIPRRITDGGVWRIGYMKAIPSPSSKFLGDSPMEDFWGFDDSCRNSHLLVIALPPNLWRRSLRNWLHGGNVLTVWVLCGSTVQQGIILVEWLLSRRLATASKLQTAQFYNISYHVGILLSA